MIEKGVISSVDYDKKVARVTFPHLQDAVSHELPLMWHELKVDKDSIALSKTNFIFDSINLIGTPYGLSGSGTAAGKITGTADITYIPFYKPGDTVIVATFSNSLVDGVILGKI